MGSRHAFRQLLSMEMLGCVFYLVQGRAKRKIPACHCVLLCFTHEELGTFSAVLGAAVVQRLHARLPRKIRVHSGVTQQGLQRATQLDVNRVCNVQHRCKPALQRATQM